MLTQYYQWFEIEKRLETYKSNFCISNLIKSIGHSMAHILLSQDILKYIQQKLFLLYSLLLPHFLQRGTPLNRGILNSEAIEVWNQMILCKWCKESLACTLWGMQEHLWLLFSYPRLGNTKWLQLKIILSWKLLA